MIDYRSSESLEVRRRGDLVGELKRLPKGCEFRYTPEFLASSEGPIALHLPKTAEPQVSEGLLNLPTFFAGLLPEGIMLDAIQALTRSAKDDLFTVLAATGSNAIGDITVHLPGDDRGGIDHNLEDAQKALTAVLNREGGQVEAVAAIAGVQPKMSLGGLVRTHRQDRFIAKFPTERFPGLPQNEAACMMLARRCGLRTPKAWVQNGVYVVERFDRVKTPTGEIEMLHLEDMIQVMNLFPNAKYSVDFEAICRAMVEVGVSAAGLLETIKLYAFSFIIGNGDLHGKNVSLMRGSRGQWMPTPSYDLVSTLPYPQIPSVMTLALVDSKTDGLRTDDFVEFGGRFGVPEAAIRKEMKVLASKVVTNLRILAGAIPSGDMQTIQDRAMALNAG